MGLHIEVGGRRGSDRGTPNLKMPNPDFPNLKMLNSDFPIAKLKKKYLCFFLKFMRDFFLFWKGKMRGECFFGVWRGLTFWEDI